METLKLLVVGCSILLNFLQCSEVDELSREITGFIEKYGKLPKMQYAMELGLVLHRFYELSQGRSFKDFHGISHPCVASALFKDFLEETLYEKYGDLCPDDNSKNRVSLFNNVVICVNSLDLALNEDIKEYRSVSLKVLILLTLADLKSPSGSKVAAKLSLLLDRLSVYPPKSGDNGGFEEFHDLLNIINHSKRNRTLVYKIVKNANILRYLLGPGYRWFYIFLNESSLNEFRITSKVNYDDRDKTIELCQSMQRNQSGIEGLSLAAFNMPYFHRDCQIVAGKIIKFPQSKWIYSFKAGVGEKHRVEFERGPNLNAEEADVLKAMLDEQIREDTETRLLITQCLKQLVEMSKIRENAGIFDSLLEQRALWLLGRGTEWSPNLIAYAVDLLKDLIEHLSNLRNVFFQTHFLIPKAGHSYLVFDYLDDFVGSQLDEAVRLIKTDVERLPFFLLNNQWIRRIDVTAAGAEKVVTYEIDFSRNGKVQASTETDDKAFTSNN